MFAIKKAVIMKTSKLLIRIAGVISLLFMILHTMFHKLCNWPASIACLDNSNRSILLTYHYISILMTGFMAFVSLVQTKEILNSQLKYSILGMFSLFYVIRIITEFTHFGIQSSSVIILVLCAIPVLCYLYPLFIKVKQ